MVPVAVSEGMTLHCPEDGRYSFFNSPYPAHSLMTGLDIYPDTTNNPVAPSPVDGEILQIRKVRAPEGHGFDAPDHDTVTIIGSNATRSVVKILHVETEARVGESVKTGDGLGPMIRSGYFGYQTPLHAHVEVRPPEDPLRVRGGYPVESLLSIEKLEITDQMTGFVAQSRKGYAQIKLEQGNPWVVADVAGTPGIIDGGIPIYGWFGAHAKESRIGDPIKLLGKRIGFVTKTGVRSCVARCEKIEARLNSIPVDLFFTLTATGHTMLVAASRRRDELQMAYGEEIEVTLS